MPAETKTGQFAIAELARVINAECSQHPAGSFTSVSTDSRTIKPGQCFFAIAGKKFDGHDYIARALAGGAACAVVSRQVDGVNGLLLEVDDTVRALGEFARWYRQAMDFKVVGVTGSVGKTTTRQMIHHVLGCRFRVHQSPNSFNNCIGVPLTLLGADAEHEVVVTELGSNSPGEIATLSRIAGPDIAVVTNVAAAHLDGFGDMETIVREKLSIAEGLRPGGVLIINGDNEMLANACGGLDAEVIKFGFSASCDVRGLDVEISGSHSSFRIDDIRVELAVAGRGNVENALGCWAVCRQLGISGGQFAAAMKTFRATSMRAELLEIGRLKVISDCYNANPASMENALEILAKLAATDDRRAVFVCGDMAELGRQSPQFHAELGKKAARAGVRLLLAVGQSAQVTAAAAVSEGSGRVRAETFSDTTALCRQLGELIESHDVVLVKGSRAVGLEKAVEELERLFNPAEQAAAKDG